MYVPIHEQVEFLLHFLEQEAEDLVGKLSDLGFGFFEGGLDLGRALLHRIEYVHLLLRLLLLVFSRACTTRMLVGHYRVLIDFPICLVQK